MLVKTNKLNKREIHVVTNLDEAETFWTERLEVMGGNCLKKYIKVIGFIIIACLFPVILDKLIFGNNISSNISNETWAGFLGSYIGGVATLLAVFITINDNNKKIEEQRKLEKEEENIRRQREKEEEDKQRKFLIRPYLDTQHNFFNQEVEALENDRIIDIIRNDVKKIRFAFSLTDKHLIQSRQSISKYVYLKYSVRNIGAGSAVDVKIAINNFPTEIAIARDETVRLYLLIDMQESKEAILDIRIDYWDTEHRAHYSQKDCLVICIEGSHQSIDQREHTYPIEVPL